MKRSRPSRREGLSAEAERLVWLANGLAEGIGQAAQQGTHPAIVTSARRRRFVHTVLSARGLPNAVISYEEIGSAAVPSIVGSIAA